MPATRPIPGIHFVASVERAPALGDLPRMDAAGFAGYAGLGPVDVPVLVEDPQRFRDVFGADLELAVDAGSLSVPSQLGPAIEAFFANEGAQCFVVRVAGGAATTAFPAPGLVDTDGAADPASWRGVQLAARCPGTALDDIAVTARLTDAGRLGRADIDLDAAELLVRTRNQIPHGALLECTVDERTVLWVTVASARVDAGGRRRVAWNTSDEVWWRRPGAAALAAGSATVVAASPRPALAFSGGQITPDGRLLLRGDERVRELAEVGAVLVLERDDGRLVAATASAAPVAAVEAVWELTCWPARLVLSRAEGRRRPAALSALDVRMLELELTARRAGVPVAAVGGLGLRADHPRWYGHLPDDHALFDREHRRRAAGGDHPQPGPLDAAVVDPRFPLAATPEPPPAVLPLGLAGAAGPACPALTESTERGDREGLAVHAADHFLDPALAGLGPETLLATARHRFYVQGRDLRGIHALLPVDEVAVAAVPDAVQPRWRTRTIHGPAALAGPALVTDRLPTELAWTAPPGAPPDRYEVAVSPSVEFDPAERVVLGGSDHSWAVSGRVCERAWLRVRAWWSGQASPWSATAGVDLPVSATFGACTRTIPIAPALQGTPTGVVWAAVTGAAGYAVQVGTHAPLDGAPIARTDATSFVVARGPVVRYARVRALRADGTPGPWSNTIGFGATDVERREAFAASAAPHRPAVDIHDALGRLAAARRDLIGLVSFPAWYAVEDVETHVAALVDPSGLPDLQAAGDRSVLLAHLVAAHPWVHLPAPPGRGGTLPAAPLDGALAGRLGRTALTRGAWIAGISAPLPHVLGPVAALGDEDRLRLLGVQVNAVVERDGRAVVAGTDTLVADPAIRPWTVRRLLILIRRLARREGDSSVFDPHGPELRRLVVTRFEQLFGLLFRLGAFAGATPDEAFRVLCTESLNPPAAVDAGRLVVELQVAPSLPLDFITVRLLQAGAATVLEAA